MDIIRLSLGKPCLPGLLIRLDSSLDVPGANLPDIYKATDFLVRTNVDMDFLPHEMCSRPEVGERVVVIGGGDTSSDCLCTALRVGKRSHLPVSAQ